MQNVFFCHSSLRKILEAYRIQIIDDSSNLFLKKKYPCRTNDLSSYNSTTIYQFGGAHQAPIIVMGDESSR